VALPALQADLHATINDVQWVIEAYALFLGALILIGGAMGDQFGRKRVFLGGVAFFTAASIFCGLATSTSALIVGRALQGIGAAFLVPGSLAIISATFADADRGRAIGTWSGFSAITSAIGPGHRRLADRTRQLARRVFPERAHRDHRPRVVVAVHGREPGYVQDSEHRLGGAGLAVLGLGGVVFGLLQWPPLGAGHPVVLGALTLGTLSLLLFVLVERRAANPMLPLTLFRSRIFTLANVLTLLLYAPLAVVFFLVPMNLIQVQGYSATEAGAALLPFPVIMFALSRWSGGLVARVGSRLPLTAGPAVAAAAWPCSHGRASAARTGPPSFQPRSCSDSGWR
jgi:MFS family permease